MKVSEAIAKLDKVPLNDKANAILDLYLKEFNARKQLRFGGRNCLVSSFESLNTEIADWINKVMTGIGLREETARDFTQKLIPFCVQDVS